ncbi:MAG: NusG domain II-containing protein [Erysipelotrichaceae bacterium]|nr:NusG domain II-containing protein [Erysipelotrichaceae bacterium]
MKRKERLITLLILLLAACAFAGIRFFDQKGETIAVKDASGAVLLEVPLAVDQTYEVEGKTGLFHLQVENQRYRAVNVDCPNHDCEAVGWVSKEDYRPIICLPNGILVELLK